MSFFAHRFFTHKIICTECRTGTYDEIFKIQTGMTILEYPESLKCIKHLNFCICFCRIQIIAPAS